MSSLLVLDPVKPEDGLDYIFAYMTGAYGNIFLRNWEGVDIKIIRQVWAKELGDYLKSKEILDYGLRRLPMDRPPSAMAFRELCRESPDIIDIQTAPGINRLASKVGEPPCRATESFPVYRTRVIEAAKQKGLL